MPLSGALTHVLRAAGEGDVRARMRLLSLIYGDLHRIAASQMRGERIDHTLQPTALVHEAYLRLFGENPAGWENRAHFFAAAAESMRRILVDHARARAADKRGGGRTRSCLEQVRESAVIDDSADDPRVFLDIDEALREFERIEPEKATIVKMRFYGGLGMEEIAAALGISVRTVKRHWRYARAWLYRRIASEPAGDA